MLAYVSFGNMTVLYMWCRLLLSFQSMDLYLQVSWAILLGLLGPPTQAITAVQQMVQLAASWAHPLASWLQL